MTTLARALKWWSYATAIGAVTLTPLLGFVVGDRRPSVAATALQMLVAVILMLGSVAATLADRRQRRVKRAAEIYRRAVARGVDRDPDDRFASTREQALAAGLPWLEADGTVTWPTQTTEVS